MSGAIRRARSTRRLLLLALAARALAWSTAALLGSFIALVALDTVVGLPLAAREALRVTLLAMAVGVAALVLWRGRAATSLEEVALWVEEHVPGLRYALVTAVDDRYVDRVPVLDSIIAGLSWSRVVATRAIRAMAAPVTIVAVALLLLVLLPDGAVSRVRTPTIGDVLDRPVGRREADAFDLSPIAVTITPPAYAREAALTVEDPGSMPALVGSRIVVRGRDARRPASTDAQPGNIAATLGDAALHVARTDDRWTVTLAMPPRPAVLRLTRGSTTRLIALEPRPDSAPVVVLSSPQRDSVYASPVGVIDLVAEASDDYGVAHASFEYIVTSGEGERFTFRQGTTGAARRVGDRRVGWRAGIALDSLELGPGDVVHLRAVARDANTVSGPSTGVSETRAIRIARAGEYDSVAIEGAPPPEPDRAALSQRMLILLTEALEARRPSLDRPTMLGEARALARDQARLRRLVGEIIFTRLGDDASGEHAHGPGDGHDHTDDELSRLFSPESLLAAADRATGARAQGEALDYAHGESPVIAINRPLLTAYNHMWDAGRELEQGEPGRALPPMRRALDALQEARSAERYFLRGRPRTIVVDIERVRLAGREAVTPAAREPREPAAGVAERHAARYARAVELLANRPAAAIDSLLVLRVDALADAPALARALDDALDALRTGRDATIPLLGARRAIEGVDVHAQPLRRWSGW